MGNYEKCKKILKDVLDEEKDPTGKEKTVESQKEITSNSQMYKAFTTILLTGCFSQNCTSTAENGAMP